MGVHTGDSVTVAPAQTLTDRLYQELRDQALRVIRAVGVETGGSNIQFAVDPASGEIVVIEMNPRVSRSSALASKATGFPIAKIAAKLAVGYALEEIDNDITGVDAGLVRADDRLRGHQGAAVRVREVPRRRGIADHAHEVGRRGDGDRAHLPRVVREGDALARARLRGRAARRHRGAARPARDPEPGPLRPAARGVPARGGDRGAQPRGPRSTAGSCASCAPWPSRATARTGSTARFAPSTPAPPSSRPGRRTTTPPTSARRRSRVRSGAATASRSSSSARGRTGSARGSSSTTAACTRR